MSHEKFEGSIIGIRQIVDSLVQSNMTQAIIFNLCNVIVSVISEERRRECKTSASHETY